MGFLILMSIDESTTPPAIEPFLTGDDLKMALQITDELDDDIILQFVNNANRKVHTAIFPYIETSIPKGSPYWSRCADAALAYARSLHAEDINQIDKAKNYMKKFQIELFGVDGNGGLIQELKKTPTSRQSPLEIERTDFEFERKIPFSQIGYGGTQDNLM